MVGVVYTSPEPGAPAFVKLGDPVAVGDTVLLIEAMKVFNPIKVAPRRDASAGSSSATACRSSSASRCC